MEIIVHEMYRSYFTDWFRHWEFENDDHRSHIVNPDFVETINLSDQIAVENPNWGFMIFITSIIKRKISQLVRPKWSPSKE